MGERYEIRVGDKVDLLLEKPPYYRSIVEDMADKNTIYVSIPTYRGITVNLHVDQQLCVYYYRQTGRYCIDARVSRIGLISEIRVAELKITSAPRKEQRRLAYRVPVRLDASIYPAPEHDNIDDYLIEDVEPTETAYTRNISETGVALVTTQNYEIGKKLLLEIDMTSIVKTGKPIMLLAHVRRKSYDEGRKTYQIGLEYYNLEQNLRALLAKYIFKQQQQILQRQRLVEGDPGSSN